MELSYYGANCIKIKTKHGSVVIDDNLVALGKKSITTKEDITLVTSPAIHATAGGVFTVDGPGEYEIAHVSIIGMATRAHFDEEKTKNATMYKIIVDDINILVLGHVYPDLTEAQLEKINQIDVLVVPVGGNGYTLDTTGALKLIRKIEPRVIVPTHYEQPGIGYEVPQAPLETFVKELGMEPEKLASLKLKSGEVLDITKLVVLDIN